MAITNADWGEFASTATGSTGGSKSGSSIASGAANNVWPNKDETARLAGGTDYRKTFFVNGNGTDAAVKPVVWFPVAPASMTLLLGLGIDSASDADNAQGNMTAFSAGAQMALISDGADVRIATITGLDGSSLPVTETVTLTGATEVLSANTYTQVWSVSLSATDASRTVTVKEGTGGTTRGVIAPTKIVCWLWVAAGTAKSSGIALPNLAAGASIGLWRKLSWTAGAAVQVPNSLTVEVQENG